MAHSSPSTASRPVIILSIATLLCGVALAAIARGLAGDEELSHYLIARTALVRPDLFLSLVGRPLVTLLLSPAAAGGILAARLVAVVATLFTVLATARLIPRCSRLPAWTSLPLLLLQPFFAAHAATAMAEPFAAAAVAWALVAIVEKRPGVLIMLAALAVTIRFELVVFWPLVALWLVRSGRGRLALCLPIPLLIWGLVAGIVHRDLLWLVHQTEWGTYPEREALHYVRTFGWIVGPGLLLPVLVGLAEVLATAFKPFGKAGAAKKPNPRRRGASDSAAGRTSHSTASERVATLRLASVLLLGFVVTYSALAWWHPVSYGNLRYMAAVAAPIALLAASGIDVMGRVRERRILFGLLLLIVLIALVWSHPLHQDFLILTKRTFLPLIAASTLFLLTLLWPRASLGRLVIAMTVGCAGLALDYRTTLHWVDASEPAAVVRAVPLFATGSGPVYGAHPRMAAELGRNPYQSATWPAVPSTIRSTAEPDTRLYWDSHYLAGRGVDFNPEAFVRDSGWTFVGGSTASDSTFTGAVFVKRSTPREGPASPEAEAWAAGTRRILTGAPRSRAVLAVDPANSEMWLALGHQVLFADDVDGARRALARAAMIDPGAAGNSLLEARIDLRTGQNDAALSALQRGLAKHPEDGDLNLQMGRLIAMSNRPGEARPYFDRAVAKMGQRWEVRYVVGSYYLSERDFASAAENFIRASRLNPRMPEPYLGAADALERMRRFAETEAILRALVRRQPGNARGYSRLGEFLSAQGRPAEARQVWQQGADRTGDPVLRQRAAAP